MYVGLAATELISATTRPQEVKMKSQTFHHYRFQADETARYFETFRILLLSGGNNEGSYRMPVSSLLMLSERPHTQTACLKDLY